MSRPQMPKNSIVAIEVPQGVLVVNRMTNQAVMLPWPAAKAPRTAIQSRPGYFSRWFQNVLAAVGAESLQDQSCPEIIIRASSRFSFMKATWELTERCNLRCIHCYLDNKTQHGLSIEGRRALLDKINEAGCLWLHLSGGEALADPLFEQTYSEAWNKGLMLIVSTNGRLLTSWAGLFGAMPPYRVNISLYGASAETYGLMTGVERAYEEVMGGIDFLRRTGIRIRVSIIVTKVNVHEVETMENSLRMRGVEHHTFWKMSPTLLGGGAPLDLEADIGRSSVYFGEKHNCSGGHTSFHIYATGKASPCRLLPNISIDLLSEDISNLARLRRHPGTRPTKPECASCPSQNLCTVCAPIYALHMKAGNSVGRVCRR